MFPGNVLGGGNQNFLSHHGPPYELLDRYLCTADHVSQSHRVLAYHRCLPTTSETTLTTGGCGWLLIKLIGANKQAPLTCLLAIGQADLMKQVGGLLTLFCLQIGTIDG